MTYIKDLDHCSYFDNAFNPIENLVSIGWLDEKYPYNKEGRLLDGFINNLKLVIETQGNKHGIEFRGVHTCNICPTVERSYDEEKKWKEPRHPNVIVLSGRINYGAPELLLHYIVDHGYIPPMQFQDSTNRAALNIMLGKYTISEYTDDLRKKYHEKVKERSKKINEEWDKEREQRRKEVLDLWERISN